MFTLIGKTNIDFVGKRYIGFAVSLTLMALGVYGAIRIGTNKAKVAIDFSGGTSMHVRLEKVEPVESLRSALKADFPDAEIQQIADQPEYLIRLRDSATSQETGKTGDHLSATLAKNLASNKVVDTSSEEVGPAVSSKLRSQAIGAFFIGMLFITIYIALRFDVRFAVGAFIATIHDVLAVLGLMVLLDRDFSLLIVTALLTLAGYSLTDTVVVFDRIRENLRLRRAESFVKVVNDSINETLSRTLNTSMTVLVVLLVLFFRGGVVLHDFSMAMLLGVLVGTYSSIFVASPVVVEWNLRAPSRS
jgi:preprotein translocase subunit SecF